jgi:hypothetical protein
MAARTGLSHLIDVLRGMVEGGTADYSIGTANFWDDDHLEAVLDRHRKDIHHEQLGKIQDWSGGTVNYFEYVSLYKNYEQTTGGTAIFIVEHGTGADVGTANYSVDYFRGRITFGSDTGGSTLYLTGRSYDLDGAAADIWKSKAGHAANMYDFLTDNHRFARSQFMKHCLEMSNYYEQRAVTGTSTTVLYRSDVDANAID